MGVDVFTMYVCMYVCMLNALRGNPTVGLRNYMKKLKTVHQILRNEYTLNTEE